MQNIILRNLMENPNYYRTVFPFLKEKHFNSIEGQQIFNAISNYVKKYSKQPTKKEIGLIIKNSSKISDKIKESTLTLFKEIVRDDKIENQDFLINETEKYIQKIEMTEAILSSAEIIKNDDNFEKVLGYITDALKIKFDNSTGMSYNDSLEHRIEYYHRKNYGLSTGLENIDKIMGGGFKPKTLNVFGAPSHVGKSMALISITASLILKKKNVLFIPLEMSEEEIGKRIDSNILDINSNSFKDVSENEFKEKFNKIKDYLGKLIIKEYPAGELNTFKLETLIDDLMLNAEYIPDAICIDYLTLMSSSRVTMKQAGNGYSYYKSIAEELHALAKKYNIPVITAAQLNRSAYGNKEAGLETIADSLGIVQTADTFIAMITDDVLKENGRMYWKFLKNRSTGQLKSQIVGTDFSKARFFDVEEDNEVSKQITNSFNETENSLQLLNEKSSNSNLDFSMINFN